MARQIEIKQVSGLAAALNARVPTSRTVSVGTGLTGGGDLTTNRTISLDNNLSALHSLTGAGFSARTGVDTWALRSINPSWGISIANTDGVGGNPLIASVHPVLNKSADYVLVIDDGCKLLVFTAAATATLPATSSAGNGWYVMFTNVSAGSLVIDGDGAELIDGSATLTLGPNNSTILVCDGSSWRKVSGSLSVPSNGIVARTSSGVFAARSIATASSARITVSNGDAVAGNPSLDLATISGFTPNTYKSVTVDAYGRVTAGSNPTTLSGYGITDALAHTGNHTFTGNLVITGNLNVGGTATFTSTGTTTINSNVFLMNDGEAGAGVTAGWSGIEIDRGSLDNYFFRFDESTDRFVIGLASGLQVVATRENTPIDGGIAVWSAAASRFDTVAASTYQASLGYTPVNKAGDTMTGDLKLLKTDSNHIASLVFENTGVATGRIYQFDHDAGELYLRQDRGNNGTVDAPDPLIVRGSGVVEMGFGPKVGASGFIWHTGGSNNPTTLGGYGITDGLSTSTTSAQEGYFGGVRLRDTNATHYLRLLAGSDLTGARTLTLTTGDADRILTLSGNATITGTNTGDQTITLSGAVSGSGTSGITVSYSNFALSRIKQLPYSPGTGTRNQDFSNGLNEWWSPATTASRVVQRTRSEVTSDLGPANAPASHVARFSVHASNATELFSSSADPNGALASNDGALAVVGETWIVKAYHARTTDLVALAYLELYALSAAGVLSTVTSQVLTSSAASWTETVINGVMPSATVRVYAGIRVANNATVTGYLFATQIRLFPSSADRAIGGAGGGINADFLQGYQPAATATINTVALRDASGNLAVAGLTASGITLSGSPAQRDTDTVFYSSDSNTFFKNTVVGMRTSLGLVSGGAGDIWGRRASTETISGAWSFSATATLTKATGDQLHLNGATSNWIRWNSNGVSAPAFTTRSVGTKLLLAEAITGATTDYAIGLASNTFWLSVPSSSQQFQLFAGQTAIATLTGVGDLTINGSFFATTKSFQIGHPTKPGMLLRHGSLEGPEFGAYVRGRARVTPTQISNGVIVIPLPEYWAALVDSSTVTVSLTANQPGARIWIESIDETEIKVGVNWLDIWDGRLPLEVHWLAVGERKDTARLAVEVAAS